MTIAPSENFSKKPHWLKVPFPEGDNYAWIKSRSSRLNLNTVCEEANCPNIGECWNSGTATFMLMGDTCTRGCRFCAVKSSKYPPALDANEPSKIADTIKKMNLNYVVLTTVNRDDLLNQGASHISRCIKAIQRRSPRLFIEMLMPDFRGDKELLQKIIDASPSVMAHNLETVRRLTPKVRDYRANYDQSLEVLRYLKTNAPKGYTKSSLMLGLGESRREILQAMEDLIGVGVDFLTIGQYLQPSRKHLKVFKFLHPKEFDELGKIGEQMGFDYVAAGPLVRSSYKAAEFYIERKIRGTA